MISKISDQKRKMQKKKKKKKKNSAVEPNFSFWIKIFIESCLLPGLETISIILPEISQNKADSDKYSFNKIK